MGRGRLVAVVASRAEPSNGLLVERWRELGVPADLLSPRDAVRHLRAGDVALIRVDVLPTLDGIEDGLEHVPALERRGVTILNRPEALIGAHDKLATAHYLARAGVEHPRTEHFMPGDRPSRLDPPVVLKPRFGSWGHDVALCPDAAALERALHGLHARPWFRRHGALAQELVEPVFHDLRLIVAGRTVAGAVERRAAPGEWRTNIALGGSRCPVVPDEHACRLGLAAAAAVGLDLVGIDLLPLAGQAGYVVLELNGATDFDRSYSIGERDVYVELATALGLVRTPAVALRG